MELEHQAGEACMLGSAMERYNLGIQDMQQLLGTFRHNGSLALGYLGGQLSDVERWVGAAECRLATFIRGSAV